MRPSRILVIVLASLALAPALSGCTQPAAPSTLPDDAARATEAPTASSRSPEAPAEFSPAALVATTSGEWSAHDPALAVDPRSGTTYVALVMGKGGVNSTQHGGIGAGDLYVRRSEDSGRSFSEPVRVNPASGEVYPDYRVGPQLAVGPRGEVYVLWVNATPSPKLMHGMRTLHFAVSTDGARSFAPPVAIVDEGVMSGRSFYDLDVSKSGAIYVVWLDSPVARDDNGTLVGDKTRKSAVRFTRSTDGGASFESSIPLGDDPCPCCNVFVLAGRDEDVYVSWRNVVKDEAGKTTRDMVVASSRDGGRTFGTPVEVNDDQFLIDGCVHVGAPMVMDSQGRIHVAWYTGKEGAAGIFYAVSSDRGASFGAPIPILAGPWVPPSRVDLALDGDDNAWLAYEYPAELRETRGDDDPIWRYNKTSALIGVSKIAPDGTPWHSPQPLNAADGRVPALATSPSAIIVMWGSVKNEVWASIAPLQGA